MLVDPQWGQNRLICLSIDIATFSTFVGFSIEMEFRTTAFWAGAEDTFFEDFKTFKFFFSKLREIDPAIVFPPFPDVVV